MNDDAGAVVLQQQQRHRRRTIIMQQCCIGDVGVDDGVDDWCGLAQLLVVVDDAEDVSSGDDGSGGGCKDLLEPFDVVRLSPVLPPLPSSSSFDDDKDGLSSSSSSPISCVLQVVGSAAAVTTAKMRSARLLPLLLLHPVLRDFLSEAAKAAAAAKEAASRGRMRQTAAATQRQPKELPVSHEGSPPQLSLSIGSLLPLPPSSGLPGGLADDDGDADSCGNGEERRRWIATRVAVACVAHDELSPSERRGSGSDGNISMVVRLECLYVDPEVSSAARAEAETTSRGQQLQNGEEDEGEDGGDGINQHWWWNRILADALEGRWVAKGSVALLSTAHGYVVASVSDLLIPDRGGYCDRDGDGPAESAPPAAAAVAYQLGTRESFVVKTSFSAVATAVEAGSSSKDHLDRAEEAPEEEWGCCCPGYEAAAREVLQLLRVGGPSAPSGVILTGCGGVGKSRLASAVATSLSSSSLRSSWKVRWVAVHDLVMRASCASEDEMLDLILPKNSYDIAAMSAGGSPTSPLLLVFDDLDVLAPEGGADDSASLDGERRLVLNSLLQVLDDGRRRGSPSPGKLDTRFLGICRDAAHLPSELTKIGRLEKEVVLSPPTQVQREAVLDHMLEESRWCESKEMRRQWSELLAGMSPGCVAADLRRLCTDARTRAAARAGDDGAVPTWNDLFEAAKSCTPSQLAALDVTKPLVFVDKCAPDDWHRIHELSWDSFAGYDALKKRIYRTVVVPWRTHLSSGNSSVKTVEPRSVIPPSGVLFHGDSGSGKTLAAVCLGSSLGLPMIKVRAADVLDRWLGGSEAAIRSIFARARAAAPSILLFDEIDAIASNRAADDREATGGVMSRLLSTLLNEMDGVTSGQGNNNVLVVACTNVVESLDAALIRPGRLEEHVEIPRPSEADAELILRRHLARARVDNDVSLEEVSAKLVGGRASAALVEGVAREAVFRAIRRPHKDYSNLSIIMADFGDALKALRIRCL